MWRSSCRFASTVFQAVSWEVLELEERFFCSFFPSMASSPRISVVWSSHSCGAFPEGVRPSYGLSYHGVRLISQSIEK